MGTPGTTDTPRPAWLILEDGSVVQGEAFGFSATAYGELVFNTGMTGYQESLTDPSYHGQVLMFTYPMVGNYGVNPDDWESDRVWPRAVVVREWCKAPSHRKSTMTLHDWLVQQKVPGISGVDTRDLTLKVRQKGCLRCFVTHDPQEVPALKARIASMPSVEVTTSRGTLRSRRSCATGRTTPGRWSPASRPTRRPTPSRSSTRGSSATSCATSSAASTSCTCPGTPRPRRSRQPIASSSPTAPATRRIPTSGSSRSPPSAPPARRSPRSASATATSSCP